MKLFAFFVGLFVLSGQVGAMGADTKMFSADTGVNDIQALVSDTTVNEIMAFRADTAEDGMAR